MSRSKRFAHSLVSGYGLLAVNILYTLVQGRMLLHFIKDDNEIGLWAVAIQVAGYFLLLDLGMSGISRILIDHKDNAASSEYGSMILTGIIVFIIQGTLIAISGTIISQCLPEITSLSKGAAGASEHVKLSVEQMALFRSLVMWQCVLIGVSFAGRIWSFVLEAHQRYDISNYAQAGGLLLSLVTLWWGFTQKLGLYSLVWSNVANTGFVQLFSLVAVWRLGLLPVRGRWGRPSFTHFRELFSYAMEIFLLAVANMLISASQVVVVTYTLGATTAGVWSFATKAFTMANQLIARMYNYSSSALAEIMVRGEQLRLQVRFQDLVSLTAAAGGWVTLSVALCNDSFLKIWTGSDRMCWRIENDFLMAVYVFTFTTTRCHVGLVSVSKKLRAMKFVYVAEGIIFVGLAAVMGRWFGFAGIITSGIITNVCCSGLYGMYRSAEIVQLPVRDIVLKWMWRPVSYFLIMTVLALGLRYLTASLPAFSQLIVNMAAALCLGGFGFWKLGLPPNLQHEFGATARKLRARLQKTL